SHGRRTGSALDRGGDYGSRRQVPDLAASRLRREPVLLADDAEDRDVPARVRRVLRIQGLERALPAANDPPAEADARRAPGTSHLRAMSKREAPACSSGSSWTDCR